MATPPKAAAKPATTAKPGSTTEPDLETYEELLAKLEARKGERIDALFDTLIEQHAAVKTTEAELFKAINDRDNQDEHLLLLAVNHAGEKGLLLSDARMFVREPNDLNKVRKSLLEHKDAAGNDAPLIQEKQGKNNLVRIFAVKQEAAVEAEEQQ